MEKIEKTKEVFYLCSHLRFVPGMPATGEEGMEGRRDEGARAIPSQNHPRRRGEMPFYSKLVFFNMRFPIEKEREICWTGILLHLIRF